MEPWDYSDATNNGATTTTPGSILNRILTVLQTNNGGGTSTKTAATAALALQRILYIGNRKTTEEATKPYDNLSTTIIRDHDRYLRVEFVDGGIGEFYVTPDDTTVQFRLAGGMGVSNRQRAETIRKALRFERLIVLRNRRRTLLFVESDRFDTFGPRLSSSSEMMLGPPALDENDSIDRRELNDNNDPGQEITQQFPRMQGRRQ
jgi:uncharacterized protein (DUF1499 family)